LKRILMGWALTPLIAIVVVVLDQWSKSLIRLNLPVGATYAPVSALERWFSFTHTTNTGAAFGLFQGQGGIFVMIALMVIIAVLYYSHQLPADSWAIRVCLGLQIGGAAGNLIDRLRLGEVTDFALFTLPLGDKIYAWPAFNVADSAIVVGVLGMGYLLIVRPEGQKAAG